MNARAYPIVDVDPRGERGGEAMGTKDKFWWRDPRDDEGPSWLFKYARENTGEHWSEKIASEVGRLLGVPVAQVELGSCEGRPGSLSLEFSEAAVLVHGNELLQEVDSTYPMRVFHSVRQHSVENVLAVLDHVQGCEESADLTCGADWFVGYLLLDAVLLNTDRHHENWGILQLPDGTRRLAPSYDHASSLGRELPDTRRELCLGTRDTRSTVEAYVARARSGLFCPPDDDKAAHPHDAFRRAAELRPTAATFWLARLREVREDQLDGVIDRVPTAIMSEPARRFAREVLRLARLRLLAPEPP